MTSNLTTRSRRPIDGTVSRQEPQAQSAHVARGSRGPWFGRNSCAATALAILLVGLVVGATTEAADAVILPAGTGRVDITPSTRIPMSGYGGRQDPFKAVHDKIFTRVVVFSDEQQLAAIITADVIGFSHQFWSELATRLESELGIRPEHLLLCPAHNHGGPTTRVYGRNSSPDIVAYVAEVQMKLVAAVKEAADHLRPVRMGAGVGQCKMNINRRALHPTQGIALGRNPDGPCDHTVSVLRLDDLQGKTVSLLFNWPCHGTVMGPRNYEITRDWPGAAARYVEAEFGQPITAPVTIGASGDINPIYGPHIDFHDVSAYSYGLESIGMILGKEVIRVAHDIVPTTGGQISGLQQVVKVPAKAGEDQEIDIRLSVLKVGKAVFAGVSGEVFNEIGVEVKTRSPYTHTTVITHCNGSSGYLVTDKAYAEGGYEARSTRVKSGAEKAIIENLGLMINSL